MDWIINSEVKKKGINGILYLTNAPKFVLAIPTPNAKIKENVKANTKNGSFRIILIVLNGLILIKIKKLNKIKIIFSTTEIIIIGLPISFGRGL